MQVKQLKVYLDDGLGSFGLLDGRGVGCFGTGLPAVDGCLDGRAGDGCFDDGWGPFSSLLRQDVFAFADEAFGLFRTTARPSGWHLLFRRRRSGEKRLIFRLDGQAFFGAVFQWLQVAQTSGTLSFGANFVEFFGSKMAYFC